VVKSALTKVLCVNVEYAWRFDAAGFKEIKCSLQWGLEAAELWDTQYSSVCGACVLTELTLVAALCLSVSCGAGSRLPVARATASLIR